MTAPAGLAATLASYGFLVLNEAELQIALDEIFTRAGWNPEREVRLSVRDRIDFLVGRCGVEIKVAGSVADVERQLVRYAASDRVDALVLVTTKHAHAAMPQEINGKRVTVIVVRGAGF